MKLVVIEGPTSTGKTNLARYLAEELNIDLLLKDAYKEKEFDKLRGKSRYKDLRRIESESWKLLFDAVRKSVEDNRSLIIEGNFFPTHRYKLKRLLNENTEIKEVYCHAKGFLIFKRYVKRNRSGERHPGHRDSLWYVLVFLESFIIWLEYYLRPLRLTRSILKVNSNDFSKLNYESIKRYVVD